MSYPVDIIPEDIPLETREALSLSEELSVKEICLRRTAFYGTVSEELFSPEM
jgi:hypothetical protein